MRKLNRIVLLLTAFLWIGCTPDIGRNDKAFKSSVYPVFDPANAVIPMPNDLLLNTDTGMVDLPLDGMGPAMKEFTEDYLNTLDGFLADLPLTVTFSNTLDKDTVNVNTIKVFDLSDNMKPVQGLKFTFDNKTLVLTIAHPYLQLGHKYVAVVTTDVKDAKGRAISSGMMFNFLKSKDPLVHNGQSLIPGADFADASQLDAIRKGMQPLFDALSKAGITRDKVAITWAFTITNEARLVFDPDNAKIPLPNDLLMDPKTGKLNFPLPQGTDCSDPNTIKALAPKDQVRAYFFCFMNSLDGFSVTSTPQMSFEEPVDQSTIKGGVKFFDLDKVNKDMTPQPVAKYQVDCSDKKCDGLTIHAGLLKPGHRYLVVATKLLGGSEGNKTYSFIPAPAMELMMLKSPLYKDGHSTMPDVLDDAKAAQLEPLRAMYQPLLDRLSTTIKRKSIIGFFTFTTTSSDEVIFDPNSGVIPFPNDFLVSPLSGKVNLPIPDDASDAIKGTLQQINKLDGFSTYTPIQVTFSRPIDLKSITLADSIVGVMTANTSVVDLGDAQDVQKNPPDASALLNMKVRGPNDLAISQQGTTLIMTPKSGHQYLPGHEYVLGLKKGIVSQDKDANGKPYPVVPAAMSVLLRSPYPLTVGGKSCLPEVLADKDAMMLEMARKMYFAPLFDALATAKINRDDIDLLVLFRTLNTAKPLKKLVDELNNKLPTEGTTTLTKPGDKPFDDFFGSNKTDHIETACIDCTFKGYLRLKAPDLSDPKHPVFGKFDTKFRPAEFKYVFVLPKGTPPFKVLLFQHGLGRDKSDIAMWADELAEHGFAAIAIDAPYHGEHPINIDGTGTGFFSPDVFAVADNVREATLDQVQAINYALKVLPDVLKVHGYQDVLDTSKAYYAGISLGGIIGGVTSSVDTDIRKAAIIVGAGHMTRIFMDTANQAFKKPIMDTLAAMGIKQGTPQWDQFFMLAQWGLDIGDPINFLSRPVDGIPMDYSQRYIVVEARNDGFVPNSATNEMVETMKQWASKPPVFHVYPKDSQESLCHGFFLEGCDPCKCAVDNCSCPHYKDAMKQAHQDVLDFLEN